MDTTLYKDIYVFIEQREGVIQSVSLELLGKARQLADTIHQDVVALLPGNHVGPLASGLIAWGADKVLVVDHPLLARYLTEPYAQAVYQVVAARKPSMLLLGATTIGRDLGPRLSARLLTGLTADCTALDISDDGQLMMTRPAFGGNLMATIMCTQHRPQMSTVRPGVMKKSTHDTNRTGTIEVVEVTFDYDKCQRVRLLESHVEQKITQDITQASVLVSGGRGVGDAVHFAQLKALASLFPNAQVSSSRAMVDAGVMDHDCQVGQTGKTVRPDLYMALGISGAIQHLAGMEESGFIIAINKDKFAPIFQVADMGIVGDVHKIVPLLADRIAKETNQ